MTVDPLAGLLAAWLPRQRWFAGKGAPVGSLTITTDATLAAGDVAAGEAAQNRPALRHLVITVGQAGVTPDARYQVLVGLRREVPDGLAHAVIGELPDGTAAYDALHDPDLASCLLAGMAEQRTAGPLEFRREPGVPFGTWAGSRVIAAEQSNTSVVFGEAAILKVLRRLFPGANPDLEVAAALARLGSVHVAPPYGWIETELDGEPVLLGVLSRYLARASDGWSLAAASIGRLSALHGDYGREYLMAPVPRAGPGHPGPSFAEEAHQLGRATAELHADLAAAFGTEQLTKQQLEDLAGQMTAKLDAAAAACPELRDFAGKVRSSYAELARLTTPVTVQRIHGDYHLGQVLRTGAGWVALDFEGEPLVPLEQRTGLFPALRDVAGMLRSFDYAARHQLLGHPDAPQLGEPADNWVEQCQQAFCAGYARAGGQDPEANSVLLRALTLEKAVYEVTYEARHRPSWLPIPLDYIAAA
ncbi:MAG TPA: phosphotransferase [Streptosporangiaceae bacterium]|nr:phosphotransferase [Streptosporangiaceae bacterium]